METEVKGRYTVCRLCAAAPRTFAMSTTTAIAATTTPPTLGGFARYRIDLLNVGKNDRLKSRTIGAHDLGD